MSFAGPPAGTPQANPAGLMSIGQVSARNIAAYLNLSDEHIPTIEKAIKDEIQAMSSHFTMAVANVQTQYEIEVANIKSTFSFIDANRAEVYGALAGAVLFGIGIGAVLTLVL